MRRSTIPLSTVLGISLIGAQLPAAVAQDATVPAITPLHQRLEATLDADATAIGTVAGLREYVGARTSLETYDGVLKGAVGTYLTGSGNGADQALLLQRLIATADPVAETRFASCAPDAELAVTLDEEARRDVAARGSVFDHLDELKAAIDDEVLRAAIDEVVAIRAQARTETERLADRLADELYRAGYEPTAAVAPAASTNVWLQAAVDGDWVDLDTTTPEGAARCSAEVTYDSLPASLGHHVRISLEAEQQVGGALERSEPLAAEFTTAELAAARMALVFGEPTGLVPDSDSPTDVAPYTPLLRVDGRSIEGTAFDLPRVPADLVGGLGDATGGALGLFETLPGGDEEEDAGLGGFFADGEPEATEPPAGDLFGELGGGLFGEDVTDAAPAAELTGLWLDIELLSPAGEVTSLRAELLDRIGLAARVAGGADHASLESLAASDGEYDFAASLWQIGLLLGEIAAPEAALVEAVDPTSIDSYSAQLDGLLRTYPAIHRDLGGHLSGPGVMLARLAPGDEEGGTSLTFDALHLPSTAPADDRAAAIEAQAALRAERVLTELAGDTGTGPADNQAIFDQVWDDGTALTWLVPGDATEALTASPQALARIEARLAEGFSVLTPERPADFGDRSATAWWLVDPANGLVRDEHETGMHAETSEYAGQLSRSLTPMQRLRQFGCAVARPAAGMMMLLFVATGASSASPVYRPLAAVVSASRKAQAAENARKAAEQAACALG